MGLMARPVEAEVLGPDTTDTTIMRQGGTILGTTNKGNPFAFPMPDGREIDDDYVSMRPEVALVMAVTADDEVVLVRQYKHGAGEVLLEFPGGVFRQEKEEPQAAAARELAEETGYTAVDWQALGATWDDPTRQDNRIHFFLARGAQRTQAQQMDENEDIEVVRVPLHRVMDMCVDGRVRVSGSIALAALGLAALRG